MRLILCGMLAALTAAMLLTSTASAEDFRLVGSMPNASLIAEEADVAADACSPCGEAACGCCGNSCCGLLGMIAPSDHCFDDFISPITNPVFFEDPRTLTEARFIFLTQRIPPALGPDTVQLYALQLRAALSDSLSVIATKDGFITSDSPLLDDGWADVALGLKYNLIADPCCQRLLSVGATYEIPVGSTRALQGNGDGEFHLFVTGARQIGQCSHWISATGVRLPSDSWVESQMWYWSNHVDRELFWDGFYGLMEVNWYHWMRSGNVGIAGIEGGDLINLGSTGVAGKDIVTGAFGFKYKPSGNMEIGVAWELPLTDERDVLDNRLTADWILRY